jgi:hypothetical protein
MEREVRRLEGLGQLGFDFCPPATADEREPRQASGDELFLDAEPRCKRQCNSDPGSSR